MRPVPVVVIDEYPQDPLKVRPVQNKEPVETLVLRRIRSAPTPAAFSDDWVGAI
jgi:hypothetical protein